MKIDIKGHIVSDDYLEVYEWFGIAATSPSVVKKAIAEAEAKGDNELLVEINSGGGSVHAGAEIYYALKKFNGTVNVEIPSIAASAASFIAMAGKKVSMSLMGQMMIHNASTVAQGNYQDMNATSEFLRNTDKTIINAYMTKTSKSESELQAMMDKETWLTPQQALDSGLIDEILFENQPTAVANAVPAVMGSMLPKEVVEKVKAEILAGKSNTMPDPINIFEPISKPVNTTNIGGKNKMDLEQLKNDHPELFKQVKNMGYTEGVAAENSRMKKIDELALPGNESLVQAAKYENPVTAEQLAMQMIKAQKEAGQNYVKNAIEDANPLNSVTPSAAPEADNVSDDEKAAVALMNIWGGNKQ